MFPRTFPKVYAYAIGLIFFILFGSASLQAQTNHAPVATNKTLNVHGNTLLLWADLTRGDYDPDPGDNFNFSLLDYGAHGRLVNGGSGMWYDPYDQSYTGTDSFPYQECDYHGACSNTAYVTVNYVNHAPAGATNRGFNVHQSRTITYAEMFGGIYDPDGDLLHYNPLTSPVHGSISNNGYGYYYQAYDSSYTGTDGFSFNMYDDFGAYSATVTVTLNLVDNVPVTTSKTLIIPKDNSLIKYNDITKGDYDPDSDPIVSIDFPTFPTHGRLINNNLGWLYPLNDPTYNGLDSFTYRLFDSLGVPSAPATITLFIDHDAENAGDPDCPALIGRGPAYTVGQPVNVTNGNMFLHQTDYQLPGIGAAINITRTYNSSSPEAGLFGRGWTTPYDESITAYNGGALLRLLEANGRATEFNCNTSGCTPVQADFHGQLIQNGNGYTLTFQDGSTHQFNTGGQLISLVDRNNNQTTLAYDANHRLTSITDTAGRVLSLTTDSNGRVLSISDSTGTIATYTYGTSNELLTVVYADNSGYQFTYGSANSNLVLTSVTDALGHILESHAYDSQGRATTSELQGGVEHYTLNYVSDTETDVTDALGHVTKYTIDKTKGRNLVTKIEGSCACGSASSQVTTWTYDSQLNILTKTNALNQTTTFTYDAQGNPLTVTDALGTMTFTYNSLGEVLTVTDPMNGLTTNTYDTHGNLLTTKDALNNTTTLTYNTLGELLTIKDALNHVATLTWNTSGQLAQVTDAASHSTTYAYDARGRITTLTNALNEVTNYEHDVMGRLKKVTFPDTSYVQYTYDLGGRRTKVRDARGNETNFAYDGANRLTSVTNADNKTTTYAYNLMSRLTSVIDAQNRTTNYEYDDFNRLVKTIYPAATTGATRLEERVEYDLAGNVKKRVDTAGRETTYDYDSANRLMKVTDTALQATQYEYNARSQITAVVDALNQRYAFAYDALGRVTQVTRGSLLMSYQYDAVGNRTQRTDYNNQTTTYAYDNLNRLTTITYPDTTTVSYAYDALSRAASATNANGTVSFSYDNRGRMSSTTDVFSQTVGYGYDANGNRTNLSVNGLGSVTYQYDVLNRLTQITDSANANVSYAYDATNKLTSRTLPNGVTASYQYDGLDRLTRLTDATSTATIADAQYQYNTASQLTQIAEPSQTRNFSYDSVDRLTAVQNPTATVESYTYDAVGNRTASHVSSTYSYQPFNRVVIIGSNSYSYDNNGNLTSKTDSTGTWTYTWDYENRLKQVTRPDSITISYAYDALGRRIQRNKGNSWTKYVYDGEDVVKDINSDGSSVDYLNGLGVDDKLRQTSSSTTFYFTQDHLGSTRALTDANGNVIENINYDSFGNGASSLTRYGYTGREWDGDAGLYYYRNRWYDPQGGRFISEDPIGLEGGINSYAYVGNSPISLIDPSGLDGEDPGFFRLQLAYWKGVGKGAVNTVKETPGFVYRLVTHPINTLESVYDDVSGRIKTLYEIVRHPREGLNAITDAIADLGPEESMGVIGEAGGQVIGFRLMADLQRWVKEAAESRFGKSCPVGTESSNGKFPNNPDDLLPELPRDGKGRIYPSDKIRIRPEQHPLEPGETFNPRHHGQHYHVEHRLDPLKSWNNKNNVIKMRPDGYTPGSGTGFLPGENFPGWQ